MLTFKNFAYFLFFISKKPKIREIKCLLPVAYWCCFPADFHICFKLISEMCPP